MPNILVELNKNMGGRIMLKRFDTKNYKKSHLITFLWSYLRSSISDMYLEIIPVRSPFISPRKQLVNDVNGLKIYFVSNLSILPLKP